jgi:hypothetical protein
MPGRRSPRALDLADDPAFRERADGIMRRHMTAVVDSVNELAELGLVADAAAHVRVHRAAPLFKLYIVNEAEAFFGFYPVREHKVTIKGESHAVYDLMGKDATLFHQAVSPDEDSTGTQYVEQARTWFESMWSTVARDADL